MKALEELEWQRKVVYLGGWRWASVKYLRRRWLKGFKEVNISREVYRILRREAFKRGETVTQFVEALIDRGSYVVFSNSFYKSFP